MRKLRYIVLAVVLAGLCSTAWGKVKKSEIRSQRSELTEQEQMRLDYYLYAALNAVEHKQHVQAFFLLELCNEIDPTNPTVCSLRGSYFQNLYGDQKALPLLRQAFEGSPDDYWYRYVVTAYEAGQRKQAMKALEQMEKRQPKDIDILELHTHILKHEKQYDKALEVLDFAEEQLPGYNVPYDYTSASMAQMYFLLLQDEKALAIMDVVANTCVEYLRFAQSLDRRQRQVMESTTGREAAILSYVLQTCERFGQSEFVDKYYPEYAAYVND